MATFYQGKGDCLGGPCDFLVPALPSPNPPPAPSAPPRHPAQATSAHTSALRDSTARPPSCPPRAMTVDQTVTKTVPTTVAVQSRDILLIREVTNRALAKGVIDSSTAILIVETWVKVETNTKGGDDELRAKLFARLLAIQFGPRAKHFVKLVFRGRKALLEELKLKVIERQLQKQQQELLRSMQIISAKQSEASRDFSCLLGEVAQDLPPSPNCSKMPPPNPYGGQGNYCGLGSGGYAVPMGVDVDPLRTQSLQCALVLASLSATPSPLSF